MMNKIKRGIWMVLALSLTACADWVSVTPKTSVESDKLFESEIGFKSALIGIYARMTLPETYGKQMTYGHLEQLVQRYDNYATPPADNYRAAIYDYKNNPAAKDMVGKLWLENFRTIANVNNFLNKLETMGKTVVITPGYYDLMKGEALGLRGFLYFDLLRLFGPVYSENPDMKCLPWRTSFDAEQKVLLPAVEIAGNILKDLEAAEELLKNDPLDYDVDKDNVFMSQRKHRMNLMAVKAVAARVYLWTGNMEMARQKAQEVIDGCGFHLAKNNVEDVSLYEETLFALGIDKMREKFKGDWAELSVFSNELYISSENIQTVFEYRGGIGVNDIRYKNGYGFIHGTNGFLCRKYLGNNAKYSEKMPLIRLSEMYYIMAEATGDAKWLNEVRHARGISRTYDVPAGNPTLLVDELNKEYQKEYFAEGQWFYFLKRHNCPTFYRCPMEKMDAYVLPTPTDEIEYGVEAQ